MTRSVRFEPESGRLRIDSATFLALASAAAHREVPDGRLAALADAGVIVGGSVHCSIEPALAAVTSSHAQLSIAVFEDSSCWVHQGWLAEVSGILEDLGDDTYDLVSVDATSMPATLARLGHLTERPSLEDGQIPISEDLLDALTESDPAVRQRGSRALATSAPPEWSEWASRLWAGDWRFTVVDVTWPDPSGTLIDRRVAVIDTDAGMTLVDATHPFLQLVPITTQEVCTLILALLPHEAECRSGASPVLLSGTDAGRK